MPSVIETKPQYRMGNNSFAKAIETEIKRFKNSKETERQVCVNLEYLAV
ncbi:hypothetical protein [Legionella donaldsonii]|nr:hypothetical protein [Legionella donaldsonii]